eukprot:scaffold1476_cov139-Chaetoceros_neogracile.AAC.9
MARYLCPNRAVIRKVTDDMIEISFPKIKEFAYNPGHISASLFEEVAKLHIKKSGNWTSSLCNLANSKSEVSILLEDLNSNRYGIVVLIAGGIGVTPMQSICRQLAHDNCTCTRELQKVFLVWASRDIAMMDNWIYRSTIQDINLTWTFPI